MKTTPISSRFGHAFSTFRAHNGRKYICRKLLAACDQCGHDATGMQITSPKNVAIRSEPEYDHMFTPDSPQPIPGQEEVANAEKNNRGSCVSGCHILMESAPPTRRVLLRCPKRAHQEGSGWCAAFIDLSGDGMNLTPGGEPSLVAAVDLTNLTNPLGTVKHRGGIRFAQ